MGTEICIEGAYKTYRVGDQAYPALCGLSLAINAGEFVGITGRSGSGKTTLLNVMGGMDFIDRGSVVVGGMDLRKLDEDRLARWRGATIGVVFQFFQLLPTLTVLENVELCLELSDQGSTGKERRERSQNALNRTGLAGLERKFPAQLSGGQQQRCAIARSIAHRPELILADEPTGNLDSQTAGEIMALLRELHADGATVVIVTHDRDISGIVDREIGIVDGIVAFDRMHTGKTPTIGAIS